MEKLPDRVPIFPITTFMPTHINGVSAKEALYDYQKLVDAHKQYILEYKPDYYGSPAFVGSGKIFDTLECKFYHWSGRQLGDNAGYQYMEKEYMRPEDYSALIEDPSDFWLRTYLPRIFGAMAGLANIGALPNIWEIVGVAANMIPFGKPEVQKALKALMAAGDEAMNWIEVIDGFEAEVRSMGYPALMGAAAKAPFDMLADTLRGTRGIMLDMYKRPDLLLEAMARLTPIYIKQAVEMADHSNNPVIFMPLHKGADGFMSDEQFRTFYWPTLKAVILGLVEEGCMPFLFVEGGFNSRLEYLQELPKASCFCIFDRTNMVKAKEVLGQTLCIGGNVPASMILTGTPEEVKAYCKNLIDTAGKGGGYIMSFGTGMDEGKSNTVHAMIDFTREYGVYN